MSTFGAMKARIADELLRPDLEAQIARAIQSAIRMHERRRFHFNEATSTFLTVDGREYYSETDLAAIPSMIQIDSARVLDNGDYSVLNPRPWPWMEFYATGNSASEGIPTDFCLYAQKLRLYPIPDAAYTIQVSYIARLSDLTSDTQTNGWMTDAEELIRCTAKADVLENVIRERESYEEAAVMRRRADDALRSLMRLTEGRAASGGVVAYYL